MAGGCRDCRTCTMPGFGRLGQDWMVGFLHLCTAGISWVLKRGTASHCPQCRHLRSRHRTRSDGSYID
ncbi:hypothetical protein CP983_05815 [Streptomyces chartreusis]|nr:hypothetical protein CP983_05815 [Streptomyces chartreusis]